MHCRLGSVVVCTSVWVKVVACESFARTVPRRAPASGEARNDSTRNVATSSVSFFICPVLRKGDPTRRLKSQTFPDVIYHVARVDEKADDSIRLAGRTAGHGCGPARTTTGAFCPFHGSGDRTSRRDPLPARREAPAR